MRIFKRNLALVLAFVMAMSLTVGAMGVEDYKDANDINFVEAVDVLTEMGILEGTDGVFNPTKVLKRAEAAKIISYMMLGKTSADNLKAATAPFADVPATHWAAGYIANCANEGILGGYGNGNFGPEDELTGTQFAKMLLCAVGYGVNGEFTGANWDIEVKKMALPEGIFEGNIGATLDAGCTREEAALYAFNTLMNVATVKYSESFGTYYVGNSIFAGEDAATTLNTECGYNFKKSDDSDDFGREGYVWKNGKNKVVTGLYGDEADATYTKSVKIADIEDDVADLADEVLYLVNGVEKELPTNNKGEYTSVGANGVLTEVYVEDEKVVKIIEIDTYVGVVGEWDEDEEEAPVTVEGFKGLVTDVEFDEDDVVLVTVAKGKIQSIVLADSFEAEVDEKYTSKVLLTDGEQYSFSKNAVVAKSDLDYETEYTVYVDNYGYIIDMVAVEEEVEEETIEGYVKVVATQAQLAESDLLSSSDDKAKVKVNFLDGEGNVVLDLATDYDEVDDEDVYSYVTVEKKNKKLVETLEHIELNNDGSIKGLEVGYYGYYMDGDAIVLVDLDLTDAVYAGDIEHTFDEKKTDKIGDISVVMGKKTELIVINDDDVDTTVGYTNFDFTVDGEVLIVIDDTVVETIYVLGETEAEVSDEIIIAYFYGWSENKDGTTIEVAVDGVADTFAYVGEADVDAYEEGMYVLETNSDDEVVELKAVTAEQVVEGEVAKVTENYVKIGDVFYYFADEEEPVIVYADGLKEAAIAEEDEVILVLDEGLVVTVYVK